MDKPVVTITQGKYVQYLTFYDIVGKQRRTVPVVIDKKGWLPYGEKYPQFGTWYPEFYLRKETDVEPRVDNYNEPIWFWNGSITEPILGPHCLSFNHQEGYEYHTYVSKGYQCNYNCSFEPMLPVDEWPPLTPPPRKPGDENE